MNNFHLIVICLLIVSSLLFAQKISRLENLLVVQTAELVRIQKNLDSLKIDLDNYAKKIEQEKTRGAVSEKKISAWFEEINRLTRQINAQEKKANHLKKEIKRTQDQLDGLYSAAIDSLQKISEKTKDSQKFAELNDFIIDYTHKRMALLPAFTSFSFDPEKIAHLSLQQAKDSMEYAIYLEYLQNARKEVNSVLSSIQNSSKEIDELLWLQERSNRFVEQIEQNRPITFFTPSAGAAQTDPQTYGGRETTTDQNLFIQAQAQALSNLINQLPGGEFSGFPDFKTVEAGQSFLSLKDYRKFLQNAEKLLKNYEKLLAQKIESK